MSVVDGSNEFEIHILSGFMQHTTNYAKIRQIWRLNNRISAEVSGGNYKDLIQYLWVSMSRGFSGTRGLLESGDWHLAQQKETKVAGLDVDTNKSNPRFDDDFGQWKAQGVHQFATRRFIEPVEVVNTAPVLRVTARRGLMLRAGAGPGLEFDIFQKLPARPAVLERSREGDWVGVDLEGNGLLDGYCHGAFLARLVAPGNPNSDRRFLRSKTEI